MVELATLFAPRKKRTCPTATRTGRKATHGPTSSAKPANKAKNYCHGITLNKRGIPNKQHSTTSKKLRRSTRSKYHGRSLRKGVVREFKECLEQTHRQITKGVSEALAVVERDSNRLLEEVKLARRKKLEQLQEKGDASLAVFQQPAATRSANQEEDDPSLFLSRWEHLHDMVNGKSRSLRSDWEEWDTIQREIYCLGVEVIGPQGIPDSGTCEVVPKKDLCDAEFAFNNAIANEEELQQTRRLQRKEIGALSKDLQKRLAAQEKQSRDEKKSRRDQMVQLAKQMMAGLE